MPIEAKVTLVREIEAALSDKLTVNEMSVVLSIISDKLTAYDLQRLAIETDYADDLLDAYLGALSVQGRSEKTIEHYRYVITRMMQSVKTPTRHITVYHLRSYFVQEKARGISDRTLESTRQVFSAYFNWLQREGLNPQNPTANLGAVKYLKKEKDIYSDVDIEKLKFGCRSIRDRAIICFLKSTGCRISEMVQLNRDDIDFIGLECRVLGKGNKERTVFIDAVTGMVLRQYLDTRTDDYPALFIGKGSQRIKPAAVRKMLNKLGNYAHVEHVHPHKFRRTLATNLIKHGMAIQTVAAILGHDKIDTTMEYVVLDKSAIQTSYRKYA